MNIKSSHLDRGTSLLHPLLWALCYVLLARGWLHWLASDAVQILLWPSSVLALAALLLAVKRAVPAWLTEQTLRAKDFLLLMFAAALSAALALGLHNFVGLQAAEGVAPVPLEQAWWRDDWLGIVFAALLLALWQQRFSAKPALLPDATLADQLATSASAPATKAVKSEQAALVTSHRYQQLLEIQRRLGAERNFARLPEVVMREVSDLLETDRTTLFLVDWDSMQLRAGFAQGVADNAIVVPLQMGIVGAAILQRKMLNIVNAHQHPYFNSSKDALTGYKTSSILAAPMIAQDGRILGAVELLNSKIGRFSVQDEAVFAASVARLCRSPVPLSAQRVQDEINACHQQIAFDRGSVFVTDETLGQLTALYSQEAEENRLKLNLKLGIVGTVVVTNQPLLIADVSADARFDASFDKLTGYRTRNILCLPLRGENGEVIGAIETINKLAGDFTAQDIELLNSVAGIIAVVVENAILIKESERQFHSILDVMAVSIDARDQLTAGHSRRVAEIAVGIGELIGLNDNDLDVLRVAATLHDYGKIGIPDNILKKVGALSDTEYAMMKRHAAITFDILQRIKFARKYSAVPEIASAHHESLDGAGYPRGLATDEIPYLAKILSVADIYEALTADRHYRKGLPQEVALDILQQNSDKHKIDSSILATLKLLLAGQACAQAATQTPPEHAA